MLSSSGQKSPTSLACIQELLVPPASEEKMGPEPGPKRPLPERKAPIYVGRGAGERRWEEGREGERKVEREREREVKGRVG